MAEVNYNSANAIYFHNAIVDYTDLLEGSVAEQDGFIYARVGMNNVKVSISDVEWVKKSNEGDIFEVLRREKCISIIKKLPYGELENGEKIVR
jgi:hypothetical protein